MTSAFQRAIVVGASSGIGAALARALSSEGATVVAVARRAPELEALAQGVRRGEGRILPLVHDVNATARVEAAFQDAVLRLEGLDLLVYCAGSYRSVALEQYDTANDHEMIAVNFSGAVAWCNAAAAHMQRARHGTIVGLSSVAGDRGRRVAPVYGASKAALNLYLESLRHRLGAGGVSVCTIRLGHVTTPMTVGMKLVTPIGPEAAARGILRAARRRAAVSYVPGRWRIVGWGLKIAPDFVLRRMNT